MKGVARYRQARCSWTTLPRKVASLSMLGVPMTGSKMRTRNRSMPQSKAVQVRFGVKLTH